MTATRATRSLARTAKWLPALLLHLLGAPLAAAQIDDLDVPYVQTPPAVVERMLDLAEVGPADYLIDLGSGDGRIAIAAAQRGARTLGVDIDPARIAEANLKASMSPTPGRVRFRRQDLFATPLAEASVVTLYLLPRVNLALRPRLLTELRPGTRVVSHAFHMGKWEPDRHEQVDGRNVYLWIVPGVAGGRWALASADGRTETVVIEQRFQRISGTADGRALQSPALIGRELRFRIGERRFHGIIGDRDVTPAPHAPAGFEQGWTMIRLE